MSKLIDKPLLGERALVIKKVDRWVARRRDHGTAGQEVDWLGWDAWVRTAEPPTKHSA